MLESTVQIVCGAGRGLGEETASKNVAEEGPWRADEIESRWEELTAATETTRLDPGY